MDERVREYMREIGRIGGRRRSEVLSSSRRREIASEGGTARWLSAAIEREGKVVSDMDLGRLHPMFADGLRDGKWGARVGEVERLLGLSGEGISAVWRRLRVGEYRTLREAMG